MPRFLVPAHAVYDWSKPHCLLVKSCKSQCLMGKVSLKLRVGKPQTIIFRYPLTVFDIDTPIARAIGALCRRWRRISMSRRGCWSSRWLWLHVGGFKQKVSLLGTNAKCFFGPLGPVTYKLGDFYWFLSYWIREQPNANYEPSQATKWWFPIVNDFSHWWVTWDGSNHSLGLLFNLFGSSGSGKSWGKKPSHKGDLSVLRLWNYK
jgi:hypothetical protein